MFFSRPGSSEGAAVLSKSTGKGLWADVSEPAKLWCPLLEAPLDI